MSIHFGTDGWRAVISETFTFHNLRLVAQAIADALNGHDATPKAVVVGFDTRFLSDRYAREVARVLAANGYQVWLTRADEPTPVVSYAVKAQGARAGVMITASHNPPRYNGVKLKAAYGGPAPKSLTRQVEAALVDNERRARGPNLMDYDRALAEERIRRFDPLPAYEAHIATLLDLDTLADAALRVVVDAMYGSGRGVFPHLLRGTRVEVHEIRAELNPGFGGVHPEPIPRHLHALFAALAHGMGQVGLATDGDADRIGAVDEKGRFVDPHRIFALAVDYLAGRRGWRGAVVRTVSTTRMIDRLARQYDLPVHETPVGFDHIAAHMLREPVLMGGEESGGMSILGHIPEGDGVLMGLLLLEMMAAQGATLADLVDDLLQRVGPAHYRRVDLRLRRAVDKAAVTRALADDAPASIGGQSVVEVNTRDGCKYLLADDSWLLIRPSGTEPVLRVYAEARDPGMLDALLAHGRAVAESLL